MPASRSSKFIVLLHCVSVLLLGGCYLFHTESSEEELPFERRRVLPPDAGVLTRCTMRTLSAGERFAPVDMVWVVDSSRSMANEQARIEQTMNEFVRDAEARSFDVRLVMITADDIVPPPLGDDSERYLFVQRDVASRAPLQALIDELPRYEGFLRPHAALHFVVVTDDDSDLGAGAFVNELDRRLGRSYVVHAVASPDVGGLPCRNEGSADECAPSDQRASRVCGAASIGREYSALAQRFGGEEISICLEDWRDVFGPLLKAVTPTKIPCDIQVPPTQVPYTNVEIRLGDSQQRLARVTGPDSCSAQLAAYYYVTGPDGAQQLTLCPNACASTGLEGVTLEIQTYCEEEPSDGPE